MKKIDAAPKIGFGDSEFSSLEFNGSTLIVYINSWDGKKIKCTFIATLQFSCKTHSFIDGIFEIQNNSPFLDEALAREYINIPLNQPYKLFQIIDIEDFPFLEIIATSIEVREIA